MSELFVNRFVLVLAQSSWIMSGTGTMEILQQGCAVVEIE